MAETEKTITLPSQSVVLALFSKHAEVREETASIGGDWSAQVGRHVENGNLHRAAFNQASSVARKSRTNELKALEHIAHLRVYLDWLEADIHSRGHVGDLVVQAETADEPKQSENVISLDQAKQAFEANAHKAPTPAESDEKVAARKRGRKKDASPAAEQVLGAGFDDLEPPAAPKVDPLEGGTGQGTYAIG